MKTQSRDTSTTVDDEKTLSKATSTAVDDMKTSSTSTSIVVDSVKTPVFVPSTAVFSVKTVVFLQKSAYLSLRKAVFPLKKPAMKPKMKRFAVTHLSLGAHTTFHRQFLDLLEPLKGMNAQLDALIETYRRAVATEERIVNRMQSFVETPALREADRRRDRLAGIIATTIRAHLSNPLDHRRQAADVLDVVFSPFRGLWRRGYTQSSAEYRNLVKALRSEAAAPAVATLGLGEEVEALAQAQEAFTDVFLRKAGSMSRRMELSDIDTRQTRRRADATYRDIVRLMDACALVAPTDALTEAIGLYNGLADVMKDIIANQGKRGWTKEPEECPPDEKG